MTAKDRNGPRRRNEVQRRARRIQEREDVPWHQAMREAGWQVRRATGNGANSQ